MSPTATTTEDCTASVITPEQKGVKEPGENDVLCGRGGSINSHPGNERFRLLVEKRKRVYLTARFKREKRLIASSIVQEIRDANGRFLTRDPKTLLWHDIGDEKARDKTSQALRENAPTIRAEIETEICEQRAEMNRDEDKKIPNPTSYFNNGWGYYYGYGNPAHPPPPPPPIPHLHHSSYPQHHPHPSYDPNQYYYVTHPDPYMQEPPPQSSASLPVVKSTLEQTANYISSGAESIKNWTRQSFSISATASQDGTAYSKPLSYKHERKMVKFREDVKKKRPCYSPVQSNDSISSIMMDQDLEPHTVDTEPNTSLMSQVANHILSSIGSWEATTVCGLDNTDNQRVPFPKSAEPEGTYQTDDMAVEWEGQEVQLVDDKREEENSMPPPPPVNRENATSSIAFSSLGSCHSWLPEQITGAASFFGGRNEEEYSMDLMEYSAGGMNTENYSLAESIGGASLTRVFEHEPLPENAMSAHMNHRALNQIPSWERSLRSRSPLSLGSTDDDDMSLISKTSSKVSDGHLTPRAHGDGEMPWNRE